MITRWGHDLSVDETGERRSHAEYLLETMRRRDFRAPVIVFASRRHAEANKRRATALGALNYTYSFSGLLRTIADLFEHGHTTG